jgi:hypothetical protein
MLTVIFLYLGRQSNQWRGFRWMFGDKKGVQGQNK